MAESFLYFIYIIAGIFALLAAVYFIGEHIHDVMFYVIAVALIVAVVLPFLAGLYLLINKGGFLGAVGMVLMLPGALVGLIYSMDGIVKIKEWRTGSKPPRSV